MFRSSMFLGSAILGLALMVSVGAAQDKKIKGQLPAGFKDLDLTAAQVEKIYSINAEYKTKLDALAKQVAELKSQQKKAQGAVLTDDQKSKYTAFLTGEAAKAKKKDEKKKDEKQQ